MGNPPDGVAAAGINAANLHFATMSAVARANNGED
jgi:hypothetical protein